MGLQYRKRTKGSKAWMNISKSGFTHSYRITDKITMNIGRDRLRRFTYNFGTGWRYVKQFGKNRSKTTTHNMESPGLFDNPLVLIGIIAVSVVIMIIDAVFL